jgi:hypothetical protein
MASQNLKRVMPPPLPSKIEEWQRFLKTERTLNDLVEDIHRLLVDDEELGEEYRALHRAVYDSQAVEGSLAADNLFLAIMIRDKARSVGNELADEKAHTIARALAVVMRRYHASRKERRDMLEGKIEMNANYNPGKSLPARSKDEEDDD